MTELQELKLKVLNNKYPFYSDEELQNFLDIYNSVNEAAYNICRNKASLGDTEFADTNIESMTKFWLSKANEFRTANHTIIKRVDEL